MRSRLVRCLVVAVACCVSSLASAEEPNNDFFSATVLEPGQLSVSDAVSSAFPDTLLGSRDLFGGIDQVNDDDSSFGDGLASALFDVPIENGEVSFSVSGLGDNAFVGDHNESGGIEVFVTVYDFFGDQIDMLSFTDELVPGLTVEFGTSDSGYFNGTYDVEIDNTVGSNGDVDFFTFTELTPGDLFTAEVLDPDQFSLDSILGWFDETGELIDSNDDISFSDLRSQLSGTVPASGEVTLAVTGHPDSDFIGDHAEEWNYELVLSIEDGPLLGDPNGDGVVDLLDLDILGANFGRSPATFQQADLNGDNVVDLLDLDILGSQFGSTASSVPEPTSVCFVLLAAATALRRR